MSDRIEKAAMVSDETIEKAVEVVWECGPWTDQESLRIARALAEAGLLAPSPLTEEWVARYANGGGAVCPTRDEADAELARMVRDSHRHRIDEPPAPEIEGIYVRFVTDWEEA